MSAAKFDLEKIIAESTGKLKEKFNEAQTYLAQTAANEMQTHLTQSETASIAQTLLDKVGFKGDAR